MVSANEICEQAFRGFHFEEKEKKDNFTIYHMKDLNGTGNMKCFDVCTGVQLSYNHLEMESCFQSISPTEEFLQIEYCSDGCFEFELADGSISFMGKGDLCVTNLAEQVFVNSRLPLKKYSGLTVLLKMEIAQQALKIIFPQAQIDLKHICSHLCLEVQPLLIRSRHDIDHIFNELYSVDPRIRIPYSLIKVIELLMFLSLLDYRDTQRLPTFSDIVSTGTKAVYQYLIDNPFSKITIAELAEEFNVAESSLKRCFRSLSGKSIGTFMKNKRMEAAADLLKNEKQRSIGEIAEIAGYENQSKFSAAFKSVFGQPPYIYRKKFM